MSDQPKHTKSLIEWRRNAVLSKLATGFSQAEIAKELQLHPSTISLDVQFLRQQAQKELQSHIQEGIPLEYLRAKTGMNAVLKRVSEILEKAEDTKTKLESMKLMMDLYRSLMSLATEGGIVERSMKIVKGLEREDNNVKMSSDEDEEVLEEENDLEDEEITVDDEDETCFWLDYRRGTFNK